MTALRLGSLFDGIGVFPLAAVRCGIEPVWASEIEKAPISITKRHLPDMVHLGIVTKLDGRDLPPVQLCHLWLTVSKSLADRQPQGTCGRKVQPDLSSHPHYP